MCVRGVSTGIAKCFILFTAAAIMLQGCIYLALSLWGLVLTNCNNQYIEILDTTIVSDPIGFGVDIIYLKNRQCGNVTVNSQNQKVDIDVNWQTSNDITHREFIIYISYITVSTLWVLSSLLVIATLCGRITELVTYLCFWPWFIFVMAGCILDVVATTYHVIDLTHITNINETLLYIGFEQVPDQVYDTLSQLAQYLVIIPTIMVCLSSRVVFIWIFNLFSAIFCITLCRGIINERKFKKERRNLTRTADLELNTQIARNMELQAATETARTSPVANGRRLATPTAPDSTYRNTDAHPERLNYPKQTTPKPVTTAIPPTTPGALSYVSPLNNRYASNELQTPVRVSAELRNQMPWSYTNAQQQQQQQQQSP